MSELNAYTAIAQYSEGAERPVWLGFGKPLRTLTARRITEVIPVLERVEAACRDGAWAVGFLTYEASPAFDVRYVTHPPTALPVAAWVLFDHAVPLDIEPQLDLATAPILDWQPRQTSAQYRQSLAAIHRHIEAGDTYQVNYTFPLESRFEGDPLSLFLALARAQHPAHAAYLDLGRFAIASVSPELFFRHDSQGRLVTRPMKGTARRGRTMTEDQAAIKDLAASEKQRAENLMIVDMMRNDLGRIAVPGSVAVPSLFDVETYPTIHQMTSTVTARSESSLVDTLAALFPCASITGAPKIRTMELIHTLEREPRGVYTGTMGVIAPGARARLNVAIRTVTVDRATATARYGTGGGIVWDSDAAREYDECRAKALVLTATPPTFALLETILWRPRTGYFLLERHLDRLTDSARYFHRPCDRDAIRQALLAEAAGFPAQRQRVRLTVDRAGGPRIEATSMPCTGRTHWRVRLDSHPIDEQNPFLFHKTTHRAIYDAASARHPDVDEVVLWNMRGELTEACRANLVLRFGSKWQTPARHCGLLGGTYRAALLDRGRVREAVLPASALTEADAVYLVNAIRGWIRVNVVTCMV